MKSTNWILTFTGKQFYPFYPTYPDYGVIDINDIAHALSNICRFTGHCKEFYSVAEHSVRVADEIFKRTGDLRAARFGLLHDASEAYLCDIARPIKETDEFSDYRNLEKSLQGTINFRFNLIGEVPRVVKEVDEEMLHLEAFHLMPNHAEWAMTTTAPTIPCDNFEPMSPSTAQENFLNRVLKFQIKLELPNTIYFAGNIPENK